jgi:hypothetical protein
MYEINFTPMHSQSESVCCHSLGMVLIPESTCRLMRCLLPIVIGLSLTNGNNSKMVQECQWRCNRKLQLNGVPKPHPNPKIRDV